MIASLLIIYSQKASFLRHTFVSFVATKVFQKLWVFKTAQNYYNSNMGIIKMKVSTGFIAFRMFWGSSCLQFIFCVVCNSDLYSYRARAPGAFLPVSWGHCSCYLLQASRMLFHWAPFFCCQSQQVQGQYFHTVNFSVFCRHSFSLLYSF